MPAVLMSRPAVGDTPAPFAPEPVALLQLDAGHPADAASAVYRELRLGRRVVAVASGGSAAIGTLVTRLAAIGLAVARPDHGDTLLSDGVTLVAGPDVAANCPAARPSRHLRVALAGCGIVGGGVLQRLLADPRFEVVGVLVRDSGKRRDVVIPKGLTRLDPAALLAREPDVLVEAISDPSTGRALICAALTRGVAVVSASKQTLAGDLATLAALARTSGVPLLYSASVGGGSPLIETVRRARDHGAVVRIEAVLNGTCNFILNRLADGVDFDAALDAARFAGFAEEDPSADLTGLDAAAKLSILAHEALGRGPTVDSIPRDTLAADAVLPAGRVRQIARLDVRAGTADITFRAVEGDALFADLPDEWNALRVTTADGRVFTTRGRGAGRLPTTEAVWADLNDLLAGAD